jgi:hypothetical protein
MSCHRVCINSSFLGVLLKRWSCLACLKRGALPSRKRSSLFVTTFTYLFSLFTFFHIFLFYYLFLLIFFSLFGFVSLFFFSLSHWFMLVVYQTVSMRISNDQIIHPYLCICVHDRLADEQVHQSLGRIRYMNILALTVT